MPKATAVYALSFAISTLRQRRAVHACERLQHARWRRRSAIVNALPSSARRAPRRLRSAAVPARPTRCAGRSCSRLSVAPDPSVFYGRGGLQTAPRARRPRCSSSTGSTCAAAPSLVSGPNRTAKSRNTDATSRTWASSPSWTTNSRQAFAGSRGDPVILVSANAARARVTATSGGQKCPETARRRFTSSLPVPGRGCWTRCISRGRSRGTGWRCTPSRSAAARRVLGVLRDTARGEGVAYVNGFAYGTMQMAPDEEIPQRFAPCGGSVGAQGLARPAARVGRDVQARGDRNPSRAAVDRR